MNGKTTMRPPCFPTRRAVFLGALASTALPAATAALADEDGDPAPLHGTEWHVREIDGKAVAKDWPVTISFDAEGAYFGRACNSFRGSYTTDGSSLSLGPAAATRMACQEPAMSQEQALFEALERIAAFELKRDGALWLLDAGGGNVVIARQ